MSVIIEGLIYAWRKNLDYGQRLVADLSEPQMVAQPGTAPADGSVINHPAWVLSHLNLYHSVMAALIRGQTFPDPREHPFGMKSKPVASRNAYPAKPELVDAWVKGHEAVEAALRERGEPALQVDVSLERWRALMPKVGNALPYLMLVHENTHLGQISMWRRVQGMPSV